jgi:transcriptional regulator with XRE-family HTH domain
MSAPPPLALKLAEAMRIKSVTQAEIARAFGVKPPTVSSDWLKHGRIAKRHYPVLVQFFDLPYEWWFGDDTYTAPKSTTEFKAHESAQAARTDAALDQLIDIYSNLSESGKHRLLQEAIWMQAVEAKKPPAEGN